MSVDGLEADDQEDSPPWRPTPWQLGMGVSVVLHVLVLMLIGHQHGGGAVPAKPVIPALPLSIRLVLSSTAAPLPGNAAGTSANEGVLPAPVAKALSPMHDKAPVPAPRPRAAVPTPAAVPDNAVAPANTAEAVAPIAISTPGSAINSPSASTPDDLPANSGPASSASTSAPASAPADSVAAATSNPSAKVDAGGSTQRISLPDERTLQYDLTARSRGMNYRVTSTLIWQRQQDRYTLTNRGGAFLLGGFEFVSQGRLTAAGLVPERYEEHRRKKAVATNFTAARHEVSFSASETRAPLTAGIQDRLSVLMQLSAIAHADPQQLKTQIPIEITVAGTKSVDPWRFRMVATEQLQTPLGVLETIHLQRLPRRDDWDQQVDIWLAPTLQGLPVRLKLTEPNGDYVEQTVTSDTQDTALTP